MATAVVPVVGAVVSVVFGGGATSLYKDYRDQQTETEGRVLPRYLSAATEDMTRSPRRLFVIGCSFYCVATILTAKMWQAQLDENLDSKLVTNLRTFGIIRRHHTGASAFLVALLPSRNMYGVMIHCITASLFQVFGIMYAIETRKLAHEMSNSTLADFRLVFWTLERHHLRSWLEYDAGAFCDDGIEETHDDARHGGSGGNEGTVQDGCIGDRTGDDGNVLWCVACDRSG